MKYKITALLSAIFLALGIGLMTGTPANAGSGNSQCSVGGYTFRADQTWTRQDYWHWTATGQTLGYNSTSPTGLEWRWRVVVNGSVVLDTGYQTNAVLNRAVVTGDYAVYGADYNSEIWADMGRLNDGYPTCRVKYTPIY